MKEAAELFVKEWGIYMVFHCDMCPVCGQYMGMVTWSYQEFDKLMED